MLLVTIDQHYNVGEKPAVVMYAYIYRPARPPNKSRGVVIIVIIHDNSPVEPYRDHVHASTAYTADDGANRSGRANVQTGAILHLPRGRRDRSPGHVR